jgi:hypothetical protein
MQPHPITDVQRRRSPVASIVALVIAAFTAPQSASADEWLADFLERRALFGEAGGPAPEGEEDDSEITTDRPDFTEASSTVGNGTLQIESGYTYFYDNDGGVQTRVHTLPEALFRYGVVADWLELRAAWNYTHEIVDSDHTSGADDLYLGAKFALTLQDGAIPEMALVPQMRVPTGTNAFSANEVLPGMNWLYGWDINEFLATGGSTQFNRAIDDGTGNTFTQWAQSWTINYTLAERLGGYTEWFAFFPDNADTAPIEHYFDGGLTFRPTKDQQFDVRGGMGLNEAAADYFVGVGYSVRFR